MHKHLEATRLNEGVDSITIFNFHSHMMPVYLASMRPQTIQNGFRRAGLFPFNSDNLDWSKVEGNERQLEAFHPDETISVQNRVNQGTQSMKPPVTYVKV